MDFKIIIEDWNNAFPFLKKYTDRTLYMVVKPFIIGIRLLKSKYGGDYFQVYFEVIPLWYSDKPFSINTILITDMLVTEAGHQLIITERRHKELLPTAIKNINYRYGNILRKNIVLGDFISFLQSKIKEESYVYKMNPGIWIPIFEILFGIAIYFDNEGIKDFATELLNKEAERWCRLKYKSARYIVKEVDGKKEFIVPDTMKEFIGPDSLSPYSESIIENIKQYIFRHFKNKDKFFATIEENCKLPRISRLNVGEFIGVDEYRPPKNFWKPPKSFWEKVQSLFSFQ